jgi:hypothetical protein
VEVREAARHDCCCSPLPLVRLPLDRSFPQPVDK